MHQRAARATPRVSRARVSKFRAALWRARRCA